MGELGAITTGNTPSTSVSEYYSDDGMIWVTPTDISNNITYETEKKLSKLGQQVGRVVPKNTILITCIASIGKNTILGKSGSFNQQINGLTPNEIRYVPYFLFTESTLWSAQMKKSAAAGTMQIVNRTEFSELKTWITTYEEQKKIGAYFANLDRFITLHQQKITLLTKLKKAMLEKMFPKKGTVIPEFRFNGFANVWEQRKLNEVLSFLKDGTHGTHADDENGPLLLSAKNIKNGKIICDETDRRISEEEYEKIHTNFSLEVGDVLLTIVGSIGETAILKDCSSITFQRSVAFLRPNGTITSDFLYSEIQTQKFQNELDSRKSTSAQPGIYLGDLSEVPIVFTTNLDEQTKIGDYFNNLDHLITLHHRKIDKIKNMKKAMLDQMFIY